MHEYDISVQARASAEIVHDLMNRAFAEGFKSGQEAMRERAANDAANFQESDWIESKSNDWNKGYAAGAGDCASNIRALPIGEPPAS